MHCNSTIGDNDPDQFANVLFNTWKIGKSPQDNGLLILQILDQRFVRLETGYGLESRLPDATCEVLIRTLAVPYFKNHAFAEGHMQLLKGVITALQHYPDESGTAGGPLPVMQEDQNKFVPVVEEIEEEREESEWHKFYKDIVYSANVVCGLLIVYALIRLLLATFVTDPFSKYQHYEKKPSRIALICYACFGFLNLYLLSIESMIAIIVIPFFILYRRNRACDQIYMLQ